MKRYRKSRKGYPDGVLLVADNRGESIDRYTVLYTPDPGTGYFPYVGMSGSPFHPQGVCQYGEMPNRLSVWGTGDRVIEFTDLPEDCQQVVKQDLAR